MPTDLKTKLILISYPIVLCIAGVYINEKLSELKDIRQEQKITDQKINDIKISVAEIKIKMESDQSQKFDRYEDILNDIQTKLEKK
jgi:hypothetical protein